MAILNQKRILNLIPKTSAPVTIHVSQGDVGTEIEFTLVKGDELFVNTGNLTASVHGVRKDGANFGPFTCVLSGSTVTFPLHSEMTAVKGSALAEIVLVDNGGNKVGSANFGILVEESVFPLGVTYDNDVSVYESILAYVQSIPAQVVEDYTSKINAVQNNLNTEISARTSADVLINTRIDNIIAPSGEAPSAAEVQDARVGANGVTYNTLGEAIRGQVSKNVNDNIGYSGITFNTLKERLDSEIMALRAYDNMQYFKVMALASGGAPISSTNRIVMPFLQFVGKYPMIGIDSLDYDFRIIYYSKPKLDSQYYVGQSSWKIPVTAAELYDFDSEYENNYFTLLIRRKDNADITESELETLPTKIIYFGKKDRFYPEFMSGDSIDFNSLDIVTKFCAIGGSTAFNTVLNAPDDFSGTFTLFNLPRIFRLYRTSGFITQILMSSTNRFWIRILKYERSAVNVYADWIVLKLTGIYSFENKNVAIIGDSVSTMYNNNAVELTITEEDVGVSLSAYITRYDVATGLTIDGYTFTEDDIGIEKTFTPRAEDVGKVVGLPNNYNPSGIKPWWYQMKQYAVFNAINVSWSGSSYSSHDENETNYKTSYAWHPAQIRKCGIRTAGTMNRTAPDYIILARGGNDWSHSPYDKLTDGYFNNYNWNYPVDDKVGDNYGFKEAIAKTVQALRAAYPTSKILICTWPMIHRINYGHFPPNNGTNSAVQFNDAIREAAEFLGLGLIELDKAGITFENFADYARDTPPVHPNNDGHLLLCEKAVAEINAQF